MRERSSGEALDVFIARRRRRQEFTVRSFLFSCKREESLYVSSRSPCRERERELRELLQAQLHERQRETGRRKKTERNVFGLRKKSEETFSSFLTFHSRRRLASPTGTETFRSPDHLSLSSFFSHDVPPPRPLSGSQSLVAWRGVPGDARGILTGGGGVLEGVFDGVETLRWSFSLSLSAPRGFFVARFLSRGYS